MIKRILINFLIIAIVIAVITTKFFKFILPDIFLILTIFNGFFYSPIFAMFFGFFSGLSLEIASSYPVIGLYPLIYTIIGYTTSISKILYIENPLTSSVAILIYILLKGFIFLTVGFFFLKTEEISNYFVNIFLIETIYTLLISIPIFLIFKKLSLKRKLTRNV